MTGCGGDEGQKLTEDGENEKFKEGGLEFIDLLTRRCSLGRGRDIPGVTAKTSYPLELFSKSIGESRFT